LNDVLSTNIVQSKPEVICDNDILLTPDDRISIESQDKFRLHIARVELDLGLLVDIRDPNDSSEGEIV
jgi:hypothetical protein